MFGERMRYLMLIIARATRLQVPACLWALFTSFVKVKEGIAGAGAARCVGIKREGARLACFLEARWAICKPHQA